MKRFNGKNWDKIKDQYELERFYIQSNKIIAQYLPKGCTSYRKLVEHIMTSEEAYHFKGTAGYHLGLHNVKYENNKMYCYVPKIRR